MNFSKLLSLLFIVLGLFVSSCGKLETEVDTTTGGVVNEQKLFKGTFQAGAHTTTGEVFVFEEGGVKKLGFTNFQTDNGPDLRIYLAEDKNAKNYTQVSGDVKNGTYSVTLPDGADPTTKKFVLIWCKAFSVLFGSAELK